MEEEFNKRRRTFSAAFKQEKVRQIEQKQITVSQLCRLYDVTRSAIYKWINLYGSLKQQGERVVVEKESEGKKTAELLKKVAELEQLLGQKQVEIEYLKKVVEFGSEMTKTDIKKKYKSQS
jgi:transposase-like protein